MSDYNRGRYLGVVIAAVLPPASNRPTAFILKPRKQLEHVESFAGVDTARHTNGTDSGF